MSFSIPRIVLAALKGGSGKTLLSLGLAASWKDRGFRVAPFKKGPDFIDAGWLGFAADYPCRNLDPFMMTDAQIVHAFVSFSKKTDVSVVEGNRGLYDGLDVEGSCSTAELAKLLEAPVIVVVDVTMTTRTVGAIIMGCQTFDRELNIAGVVLNRVAGSRQEKIIRETIERYCDVRVLGAIPKLRENLFPERHMGLVPYQEREHSQHSIAWAKEAVEKGVDLDAVMSVAGSAKDIPPSFSEEEKMGAISGQDRSPRIGYILDKSFWFYYPENLEILKKMGASLVKIDSISSGEIPPLDALYIGGGFPECQAQALAVNNSFRDSLRDNIERGLPVYAECGGLIYLGQSLTVDGTRFEMVGALPIDFFLEKRPQGHGYTVLEVEYENPFYPVGQILRGHEFHYSRAVVGEEEDFVSVFSVKRGHGVDGLRDGICRRNLLATYTHIHAGGNPKWGEGIFNAALKFMKR